MDWSPYRLTLIICLAMWDGKSEWLTYSRETTNQNLVGTLEWYANFSPCTRQLLPTVGHTVRFNLDPFPTGETINCWPPWDIDSCLVLAPDPSAKKTQSWNSLTKMKWTQELRKRLCHHQKSPEKELSLWSEKTDTVNNKDGVYEYWWDRNNVSKGGSTRDPGDDRWILRRPRT